MRRLRSIAPGLAGGLLCAAAAVAGDLVDLSPGAWVPGQATPPAQAAPGGGVLLPLPFDAPDAPDRVFWDIPLRRPDPDATALAVDLTCDDPAATRAITLHLRCGRDWLSAQKVLETPGQQTLHFNRSDFAPEGGHPAWRNASALRLSLWRGAPRAATLVLRSVRAPTQSIAILRGTELTAPGESALAARCAARALRLFEQAGLSAAIVSDDIASLDLRPFGLLVLPYNPGIPKNTFALLERHVRRGGRLAVFYGSDERLARLLGFDVLPYATQSVDWTTVSFDPAAAAGLPASMPHLTRHLLPVRAEADDAATLGRWLTPDGISDRSLPAAAASPRGIAFSHIPPLASPSAIQWLLAALAASDPARQPALDRFLADSTQRDDDAAALLRDTPASESEIRAVWALPLSPRLREATLDALARDGINTLFEQLATLADNLPENPPLQTRISRAVALARTNRLQVHAWIYALNAEPFGDRLPALRAQGRLMQDATGASLPWLCPLHGDNSALLAATMASLARLGVDGIHLDYIRYPGRAGCYCPLHRAAFERQLGQPVDPWPADVLPGGPRAADYESFCRAQLESLIQTSARAVRSIDPALRLSAAVYPTPESAAENLQDWPAWLRGGLLDFVSPMLYVADASRFADQLDRSLAAAPSPRGLLPGIGTGADESQLDALAAAQQIRAARQRNTAGFALFQLDSDLATRLLPALAPLR